MRADEPCASRDQDVPGAHGGAPVHRTCPARTVVPRPGDEESDRCGV
jgi:hypothetical protein